jgi:cytochrome P450
MTLSGEALTSVAHAGRTSSVSSIPPSIPPPDGDGSPELVAVQILSKGRGVVPTESWVGRAIKWLALLVARIAAVPAGASLGFVVGTIFAPALLFVSTSCVKRVGFALLSPFLGLYVGAAIGWRYLSKGKLAATPLIARTLHRYAPIFTLPKALTHQAMGLVVVTRHRDVREVLERHDVFCVDGYNDRMRAASGAFFLGMDAGADYDREHGVGMAALGREHALLREGVGRLSKALVQGALERPSHTLDVVSEFVHVVQLNVLKEYFGVPDTRDERLLEWLETMSFFIFNLWIGGPYRAEAARAGKELAEHLGKLVRERVAAIDAKRPITEDVLGRLLIHLKEESPAKIDEGLAVRTMGGLISGATVPTMGTFVQVVDRLLDLPSTSRNSLQRASLTPNDNVVRKFVREAARFSAYPPTLYRHAKKPFVFAAGTEREKQAAEGAWVLTMPVMANFDGSVFPRPEVFDPNRDESKERAPLLFGWSRHRCVGEHMAELLLVEMVKCLFARTIERVPGAAGRVKKGDPGTIPGGDYARRLIVRFR